MNHKPDIFGPAGKAWRYDLPALCQKLNCPQNASVAMWLLHCPGAHPLWAFYSLTLMHLRPMPDERPTIFYLPNATHEMVLYACAPDWTESLEQLPPLLQPANFAAQFITKQHTDKEAVQVCALALQECCDGSLSPDTDYTQAWAARFGDNMLKK